MDLSMLADTNRDRIKLISHEGKWKTGFEMVAYSLNVSIEYLLIMNFIVESCLPKLSKDKKYVDVICYFNSVNVWKKLSSMSVSDIVSEPIFGNQIFTFKGKCLYFNEWIESGILYIKDIINPEESSCLMQT